MNIILKDPFLLAYLPVFVSSDLLDVFFISPVTFEDQAAEHELSEGAENSIASPLLKFCFKLCAFFLFQHFSFLQREPVILVPWCKYPKCVSFCLVFPRH